MTGFLDVGVLTILGAPREAQFRLSPRSLPLPLLPLTPMIRRIMLALAGLADASTH